MCLAIPAKVIELLDNERAIVSIGDVRKEISIALVKDILIGDYVIIHVGYALTRLDTIEARKTLNLFTEMLRDASE